MELRSRKQKNKSNLKFDKPIPNVSDVEVRQTKRWTAVQDDEELGQHEEVLQVNG